MVGCNENIINLPYQQLLVCSPLYDRFIITPLSYFSKLMDFYKRAIMVGCSENIINSPDQLPRQAIGSLWYATLLAGEYTITLLSYFF